MLVAATLSSKNANAVLLPLGSPGEGGVNEANTAPALVALPATEPSVPGLPASGVVGVASAARLPSRSELPPSTFVAPSGGESFGDRRVDDARGETERGEDREKGKKAHREAPWLEGECAHPSEPFRLFSEPREQAERPATTCGGHGKHRLVGARDKDRGRTREVSAKALASRPNGPASRSSADAPNVAAAHRRWPGSVGSSR